MKLVGFWREVEPLVKHAFSGTVLIALKFGVVQLLKAFIDWVLDPMGMTGL